MSDTPKTDAAVEWATFRPGPISSIAEFARSLERENAALRKDKERLDWLEKRANFIEVSLFGDICATREDIDRAMKFTKGGAP